MRLELIRKALNEGNTLSAIATPELDKVIADLLNFENPLRQMIPRKKGSGSSYVVIRRTPTGGGDVSGFASWIPDTGVIPEATGTYSRVEFNYKTLAVKGRISRKLQQEGKAYADIATEEINARTEEMKIAEEDALINANIVADDSKPLGIIKQLNDTNRVLNGGGNELTLSMIDELLDMCKGKVSMLIVNKVVRRRINSLLQAYQRWVDKTEVAAGFRVATYNDVPIIVSDLVRSDYSVDSDGKVNGFTNVDADKRHVIIALNTNEFFVVELTPVKLQPLAQTTSQYDEFEIYEDVTYVLRNPITCAYLSNIKV